MRRAEHGTGAFIANECAHATVVVTWLTAG